MQMTAALTRRSSLLRAFGPARDLGFASAPYLKRYALEKCEETFMRLWSTRIISTIFPVPNL